jgi:hypothetical protein
MEVPHVPCPVPLERPWSPAGYQVVEVANEWGPAPRPADDTEPARQPSSPLGYRVTVVPPAESPRHAPAPRTAARRSRVVKTHGPRRHKGQPFVLWGALAAGGLLVVIFMCALITGYVSEVGDNTPQPIVITMRDRVAPQLVRPPVNVDDMAPLPPPRWAPPQAGAMGPMAPMQPMRPAGAKDDCAVCRPEAPARGETFGTTVSFARNPAEAFRGAEEEHKLTFVLHVSGNFEEARFT